MKRFFLKLGLLQTRQQTNQQIAPKRAWSRKVCSIFNKSGNGVSTSTEVNIVGHGARIIRTLNCNITRDVAVFTKKLKIEKIYLIKWQHPIQYFVQLSLFLTIYCQCHFKIWLDCFKLKNFPCLIMPTSRKVLKNLKKTAIVRIKLIHLQFFIVWNLFTRDRLELWSKFNDIFKNYLTGIVK
jgi:hypothetical protein